MSEDGKKLSIEELIKGATEYVERCVTEKLYEIDFIGKDATEIERPKMIVMSIFGLCHHLGIAKSTWDNWKKDKKYLAVLSRIETTMTAYNIEGASAGFLQQNIIARIEGIKDKNESDIKITKDVDYSELTTDELLKRAEALSKLEEDE
jgi:hypothetical protein